MAVKEKSRIPISTDKAWENRAFIRMLLERNNPDFAAWLEREVRALSAVAATSMCQCP